MRLFRQNTEKRRTWKENPHQKADFSAESGFSIWFGRRLRSAEEKNAVRILLFDVTGSAVFGEAFHFAGIFGALGRAG